MSPSARSRPSVPVPVRSPAVTAVRVASAVVLGALAFALGGCAMVSDSLDDRAEIYYPTHESAAGDWGPDELPAWIPNRATHIHRLTADNGRTQVVRIRSDADLPPDCTSAPRSSLPFATREWMPDVSDLDSVESCGDWEVAPVSDGYVAWLTPTRKAS